MSLLQHNTTTASFLSPSIADNIHWYLYLFLAKVVANCAILLLVQKTLLKSLVGFFCLSLFLADLCLFLTVVNIWSRAGSPKQPPALCSVLELSSRVYSTVPLPVCALGAIDYYLNLCRCRLPLSCCAVLLYVAQVLLVWAGALVFSIQMPLVGVKEHRLDTNVLLLLCPVQNSMLVNFYGFALVALLPLIVLFFWKDLVSFIKLQTSRLQETTDATETLLLQGRTSSRTAREIHPAGHTLSEMGERAVYRRAQWKSFLLFRITACFVLGWFSMFGVYLLACFYQVEVPSYIGFNLLWLLCLNSFLIGGMYWLKEEVLQPVVDLPDSVCCWGWFLQLSERELDFFSEDHISTTQVPLPDNRRGVHMRF
ncbi:probable G-protein coupled receptor 160 [Latimeria chalumnae]|uniref:probable G-protein coupled receptor 160 n=1 Tax=Latimeria chalumnae TaxID=7897 RepID=UPI00313CECB5